MRSTDCKRHSRLKDIDLIYTIDAIRQIIKPIALKYCYNKQKRSTAYAGAGTTMVSKFRNLY